MNERIKELAEQAGLKYHNWITNESNINDGDFKYPRLEDYEKFAESIVREMCQVIDADCQLQMRQRVITNLGGLNQARELIEKHFGVEE